jgi:hypothetical protein
MQNDIQIDEKSAEELSISPRFHITTTKQSGRELSRTDSKYRR